MQIRTKFNVGQSVWMMSENKACEYKIEIVSCSILISKDGTKQEEKYMISGTHGLYEGKTIEHMFDGSLFFPSNQKLIESL